MKLHLYSFQPDLPRLMRLAARECLLPPGDDPGYAIHAVLAASFGALAPKPWVLLPPGQGGGPSGRILGYGQVPIASMLEHAGTYADPAFTSPLVLEHAEGREMLTRFEPNQRIGFRVRLRPVARTGKQLPGHPNATSRDACERDVFLSRIAALQAPANARSEQGTSEVQVATLSGLVDHEPRVSRAECYLEWLDARLQEQGATLVRLRAPISAEALAWDAQVMAFRFTRLMSRDRSGRRSGSKAVNGPDAVVTGTLVVRDPARFAEALARGIGRFRAFGFGMLLLSPPRL